VFSNLLLQLIILFLPTQFGLHFWPDFSRAAGVKIDFLSPTLYFTDTLLFLYLLSYHAQIFKWLKKNLSFCLTLFFFALANTLLSVSPLNSFYWWVRLLGYLLFFLCLRLQKVSWSQVKTPLILSTFFVVALQIFQAIRQASLGGLFYFLGERSYTFSTPGLAKIDFFGREILRSPSLFSHPNSAAGYLLIVFYLLNVYKSPLWQKITLFFALLLTLSKGALLALALVIFFKISPLFLISFFFLLSLLELFSPSFPQATSFVSDRLFFMKSVKSLFLSHPLFGVGLGGFIPSLAKNLPGSFLTPAKLQPVHNLFLLALTELGLFGVSLISFFIYQKRRFFKNPQLLGLLALICITGTFDHYWWTLPQNRLILLFSLSLLL